MAANSPITILQKRGWRQILICARGTVAARFAILGAVFSATLIVGGDIGLAWYRDMQVEDAAQAGAKFAAVHGFNSVAIKAVVTDAAPTGGVAANPDPMEFCGCPDADGFLVAVCGTHCMDGTKVSRYAKVSASRSHSTVVQYPWIAPRYTQSASVIVRIR
jgi:hypothetical protein